jgi:hypothetical protein
VRAVGPGVVAVNQRPIVSRYQRPNLSSCSG